MIKPYKSILLLLLISHGIECDVSEQDKQVERSQQETKITKKHIASAVGVTAILAAIAIMLKQKSAPSSPAEENAYTSNEQLVQKLNSEHENSREFYTLVMNFFGRPQHTKDDIDVAKIILARCKESKTEGIGFITTYHLAKQSCNQELLNLIKETGFDIDEIATYNLFADYYNTWSALTRLVFEGNTKGVEFLTKNGINPLTYFISTIEGMTLLKVLHSRNKNDECAPVINILQPYTDAYCLATIQPLAALPPVLRSIVQEYYGPMEPALLTHILEMLKNGTIGAHYKDLLPTIAQLQDKFGRTLLAYIDVEKATNIHPVRLLLENKANPYVYVYVESDKSSNPEQKLVPIFNDLHIDPEIKQLFSQYMVSARLTALTRGKEDMTELDAGLFWNAVKSSDTKSINEYLAAAPDIANFEYARNFSGVKLLPLERALCLNHPGTLFKQLIDAKADPNIRDTKGRTILHRIITSNDDHLPSLRSACNNVEPFLTMCRPNPFLRDDQKRTPKELLNEKIADGYHYLRLVFPILDKYEQEYKKFSEQKEQCTLQTPQQPVGPA